MGVERWGKTGKARQITVAKTNLRASRCRSYERMSLNSVPDMRNGVRTPSTSTTLRPLRGLPVREKEGERETGDGGRG